MRYVCLNCGDRFEIEAGKDDKKTRCPSCMRVTGIEKVQESKPSASSRNPWLVPGVAIAVLAAIGGGYAMWRSNTPREVGDEVPLRPLEQDEVAGHLRRLRVDGPSVASFLTAGEGVEAFAESATEGRRSATDMAEGVYEAIRARAAQHGFSRWSLGVPRETPLGDAEAVRGWIREDGARRRLYPLEAAALMVAALRSRGVPAMVAEVWRFPGDRAPPDPSGHFGYYVAAVYDGDVGEGEPHLYDPWAGHEVQPEEDDYRVLNDIEALGAALNLRAIHLLVRENDPTRAMEISSDALRLDPRSPATRSVRGAILIASGGANEGVAEFEAASQIRADAPRHQLLASVHLAQGDLEGARRELQAALELAPDYAAARAVLATLHLSESEPELAREELERAQRLDPDLHMLPGLWAGYYATTGDLPRAIESARTAVERNPTDIQTRLMAARVYRAAGRYDDMRREAREVMQRVPAGQRADMEQLIRRLLGPSALEDPLDEAEDDDELFGDEEEGDVASDDSSFQLGGGSRLLGAEGAGTGTAPSLLEGGGDLGAGGGAPPGGQEPLLRLGDPSRLRLGGGGAPGGGDGLRLDLGGSD
ncbi:MAG: tetratricopeptide repeat protein [Myxococcota bacterium]|nr:tetratricopeptide repeat protein [Myxococcota bacterium]